MLSFWDTMLGQRLAETLNQELPRLNRKKEQYTKLINEEQAVAYIETEIAAAEGESAAKDMGLPVDNYGLLMVG